MRTSNGSLKPAHHAVISTGGCNFDGTGDDTEYAVGTPSVDGVAG